MQVKHDSSSTDWWLGKLLESRSWDVVRGSRFRGLGKEKEIKEFFKERRTKMGLHMMEHPKFKQLHSKCLYVDRLPPNYRDMAQYRKVFSVVKNPPYCQVNTRTDQTQLSLVY